MIQRQPPNLDEIRTDLRGRLPRDGARMLLARVTPDQAMRDIVRAEIAEGRWPEFELKLIPVPCGPRNDRGQWHVVRVINRKGASGAVPAERDPAAVRPGDAGAAGVAVAPVVAAPEPGPAAGPAPGRPVAVTSRGGRYAALKAQVAKMQPGDMLLWPDAQTKQISGMACQWGQTFGFRLGQFKAPDGRMYITRKPDAPASVPTVENGGVLNVDAEIRRLRRQGYTSDEALGIVDARSRPPDPAKARQYECGCIRPEYCYGCTTPDERARLDAALVESGRESLKTLDELADKGAKMAVEMASATSKRSTRSAPSTEPTSPTSCPPHSAVQSAPRMEAAPEIIPADKMPPSPFESRGDRAALKAVVWKLQPGEGVVWNDPPRGGTASSLLSKWNRKLPFNCRTFLHDGKRYIQRREETPS